MHAHALFSQRLAIGLAVLAGYVDAVGFLSLGGFFLSFMSGNSTRFAVGVAEGVAWRTMWVPIGIIALFVMGVMVGRFIRHVAGARPSVAVLLFMTILLVAAGGAGELQMAFLAAPLMAIAMGAANNVFVRDGEVSIGVTYMTGTLVKFRQRLAGRLLGERDSAWLPYLLLWLGLLCGALMGAFCYGWFGLHAIWIAAGMCAGLTIAMGRQR